MEAFVAPTPDSVKAVTDWLTQHDIHAEAVSPSGDMLRIDIPVSKANTLLVANFTDFKDKNSRGHSDSDAVRHDPRRCGPAPAVHLSYDSVRVR